MIHCALVEYLSEGEDQKTQYQGGEAWTEGCWDLQ